MSTWPRYPFIYEINTWVWLHELARRYDRPVTLETVPSEEWEALNHLGMDGVWLMGVWERSPAGIRIARDKPDLRRAYREALPGFSEQDVVGSPYAVHRYSVDEHLGGASGLARARSILAERGLRLILDYVPNHVARDHPWAASHPEYFIRGTTDDLRRDPDSFFGVGERIIACGRDPYFPPWTDTAQLNVFNPALRAAATETLCHLTGLCDGVRCDMAMLLLSRVFGQTWGSRAGPKPASEFWSEVIEAVRERSPGFLFLGEAYWDLENELQQLGFDYCYDKRLYDRLAHSDPEAIRLHLSAALGYQDRLVRFIENHDEPRAAHVFHSQKLRAAALAASSLPGAKLFHDGQFEGRRVKLPVQLGRRPPEEPDSGLRAFYGNLMESLRRARTGEAEWRICEPRGWPDNASCQNLLAWCWRGPEARCVVVLNYSERSAQARVPLPWRDLAGESLGLTDLFTRALYTRDGNELLDPGLYVDLPAWGFHFLLF